MAAVKTVEGDFSTALKLYLSDLEEERKFGRRDCFPHPEAKKAGKKCVYLSFAERDRSHEAEIKFFEAKGYAVVTPFDVIDSFRTEESTDPLKAAVLRTATNLALIDSADFFIAELSDFRGNEPANDVAFESGYAFGKGKRCLGVMENTDRMRARIPQRSEGLDIAGNTVENFDLPINLMFSACFEIFKGSLTSVADRL
jgi:Nucleoside 2-deoxyribosyltransferase